MSEQLVSPAFAQFVGRHFGTIGRAWLDLLPERVEYYPRAWGLDIGRFLPGGLLSCCLAVSTANDEAVLKLAGPWAPVAGEATALEAWNGGPAPKLLPPPLRAELHDRLPPLGAVVHDVINTAGAEATTRSAAEAAALRPRLELARTRARSLLAEPHAPVLLHGDLENKNILHCDRRGLAAIDPLPCIGDAAYDAGYWLASAVCEERRNALTDLLAEALNVDPIRLHTWAAIAALDP